MSGRKKMSGKRMFSKKRLRSRTSFGLAALTLVLGGAALLSQQPPAAPTSAALEFPVTMLQKVAAGKTPAGTKVQAKLTVATLVEGVVIPQDATLYGEVTESAAKSSAEPSRLGIRMDSVRWKNGSAPIKVYLTAWYYPETRLTNQNLENASQDASNNGLPRPRRNNRTDADSGAIPPASQRLPGHDTGSPPSVPEAGVSPRRVAMKDIDSVRNPDGSITLTSQQSHLKLDKHTTYVLAAGALLPAK